MRECFVTTTSSSNYLEIETIVTHDKKLQMFSYSTWEYFSTYCGLSIGMTIAGNEESELYNTIVSRFHDIRMYIAYVFIGISRMNAISEAWNKIPLFLLPLNVNIQDMAHDYNLDFNPTLK